MTNENDNTVMSLANARSSTVDPTCDESSTNDDSWCILCGGDFVDDLDTRRSESFRLPRARSAFDTAKLQNTIDTHSNVPTIIES